MAKVRIGIATQFELENELVGIGTDNPTNTLHALGNIHAPNAKAIGVSTLTTYQGFVDSKARIEGAGGAKSGSTSGEIIIEGEVTVSTGTTFASGPENLTVTDSFTLPNVSDDRPSVGSTRFNENLAALEFYTGTEWRAVNSYVDSGNRGRGVFFGGYISPAHQKTVDFINIQSRGNSQDFGQLSAATRLSGGLANSIRGINAGGLNPGYTDTIEYITMASSGTPIDFGNLTQSRFTPGGAASSTRGVFMGGYTPSPGKGVNTIDYVEIMSLGNAIDFGDDQYGRYQPNTCSSPTRGIIAAGQLDSPATLDVGYVDYITIASKGNATTFGELGINSYGLFAAASSTRGVFGGSQLHMKSIHYITMASTGNGIYFGDLATPYSSCAMGTVSTQTRGIAAGGRTPTNVNTIESVEIATTGNAVDFGDRIIAAQQFGGCSDSHGGLGGF